jgi:hypothetical protein
MGARLFESMDSGNLSGTETTSFALVDFLGFFFFFFFVPGVGISVKGWFPSTTSSMVGDVGLESWDATLSGMPTERSFNFAGMVRLNERVSKWGWLKKPDGVHCSTVEAVEDENQNDPTHLH